MLKIFFIDDGSREKDLSTGDLRITINELKEKITARNYKKSTTYFKENIDSLFVEEKDQDGNIDFIVPSFQNFDLVFIHKSYTYKGKNIAEGLQKHCDKHHTKVYLFSGSASNIQELKNIKRNTIYPNNNSLMLFLDYYEITGEEQEELLFSGTRQIKVWIDQIKTEVDNNLEAWEENQWKDLLDFHLMKRLILLAKYDNEDIELLSEFLNSNNAFGITSYLSNDFHKHIKSQYQ